MDSLLCMMVPRINQFLVVVFDSISHILRAAVACFYIIPIKNQDLTAEVNSLEHLERLHGYNVGKTI